MRNIIKNGIEKILIILILIIMLSNFIMPNYVQAGSGEKLAAGFFYLLRFVGDIGIRTMQSIMVGADGIQRISGKYEIYYSPGIIFSNTVPGLDINFISPMSPTPKVSGVNYAGVDHKIVNEKIDQINNANRLESDGFYTIFHWADSLENEIMKNAAKYNYDKRDFQGTRYLGEERYEELYKLNWLNKAINFVLGDNLGVQRDSMWWTYENKLYLYIYYYQDWTVTYEFAWTIFEIEFTDYEYKSLMETNKETYIKYYGYNESIAGQLQNNIAKWYVALRTIALVGLLSALVYIGIRIVLSSGSAQNQAKYKNMLKDWIVALCILFTLHYMMTFMLEITNSLNNIIKSNIMIENQDGIEYDKLMSTVREKAAGTLDENEIKDDAIGNIWQVCGYNIMYLTLVILTGVFTFQYLKRVVFMAFLTMISPLVALTYPLDKIKDGKAQAFGYLIREYIFNCLIQPVHLLLYTIFVTNAIEFATNNMLYSIVVLAFLVPAEKIIKEMFGLKSQSPTGNLGAAAGGAFVMSMLNKIKAKPPKDGAGNQGGNSGSSGSSSGSGGSGGVRTATQGIGTGDANQTPAQTTTPGGGTPSDHATLPQPGAANSHSITRGLGAVAKKHISGANALATSKKLTRAVGGAALGTLAGTAAIAANVADGDLFDNPTKAIGEIGATAAIGYHAGNNLVGRGMGAFDENWQTFKKGYYGTEDYNKQQAYNKFFASEDYQIIAQDAEVAKNFGKDTAEVAQTYLNYGIKDGSKIREGMKAGLRGDEYNAVTKMGITSIKDYVRVRNKNSSKSLNAAQIAARMQLAKNLPNSLYGDQDGFVRYAKRFGIEESDAKTLFKEIDDFT